MTAVSIFYITGSFYMKKLRRKCMWNRWFGISDKRKKAGPEPGALGSRLTDKKSY
jgi:hypothetical protein